jgi:GTPase Era involved in 16S rRNA processing
MKIYIFQNLIPWLTQPVIKWESSPGKIVENHLFLDDYKMIVTLRIGNNEIGKCGKSTIINQILSAKNAFSCCGEPGADKGKSFTSDGTVEFIWLTQETSSNKLWESVLQNHYKKGVNELIILANLHGNSLEFEDNLKLLGEIATSFIVFMMPENNENSIESWNKLAKYLGLNPQSEKLSYVAIDPPPSHKDYYEKLIIHTSKIADDSNIAKLRSVLKNSLKLRGKQLNLKFLKNIGKVRVAELIETEESSRMIKHIREATCEKTKRNLSLQKGDKTHFQCSIAWKENEKLKELIELMGNILLLDTQERIKAMTHLEKELGIMSDQESGNARQEFLNALDDLQKLIGAKIEDQVFVQQKKFQVNKALKKMNNISLGLEHFYREIGKIYEIILAENPKNKVYENFAKKYAELVIAGQAIEILDGDSGSISGPWLTAICNNVYKQIPKMRIFVVSILGLQSSGKSTLLNALFGCKFAVSVGRCTKGLFIRLLFLDEIMKKKLNFDALLLIDTEGLGTPEKQNEADAERKDRLMATFAMSVSHLTIVNVLGEYMRDLTEILQIAIVALARLEKADISPDIIMVQHLTERNSEKLTSSIKQFGDALEKAINISDEKDVNLGVRNSKCLNTLRERIAIGKLFRQFRPFKNGASVYSPPSEEYHQDVVDLFKFIIDIAHESKFRSDFKQWRILVQSYWDSLKSENFMRFKDVKELQEFLQRGQIISKVKESIESSFREHATLLRSFMSEQAKKMNEKIVTQESIFSDLKFKLKFIPNTCPSQPACERCIQFNNNFEELLDFEDNKPSKHETELTLENFINGTRDWHFKQLSQMLSAIAFRQIESSEFHEKIEKRLRQQLYLKKKDFTDSDIESIAGKIWHDIEKEAAERVTQISVLAQIKKEMSEQQIYGPKFVHDFKNYRITSLKNIPAIKKTKIIEYDMFTTHGYTRNSKENEMLESQQIYELEGKISEISEIILNEENAQNFQTGMISKVINNVEQIISDFESHNGMKLKTEFKLKLHLLANQIFGETMNIKQLEWDKKYNPLTILQENKSQYYDVIIERLKHGFNFDSDGMIAGNCLLKAIKQKTEKELKTQKIDYILDTDWLINSESVRLKYFSELVEEIKKGNLKRALSHFEDPRANIESWFSEKVDKIPTDKVSNEYTDNLNSKIETVVQDIRKMTTIEETRNYIENYISSCNGINAPPKLVSKKADKTEIEIYKYGIIKVLRKADIVSEKNYFIPSKEKRVMDRLGCTRSCPVCSALCWGQRRHAINSGETRKHHTCHQPMGLSGTKYRGTDTLLCESCHDEKPSNGWFVGMKGEPMSWDSMIKSEKYNNWKYGAHVYSKFNDLMKWFFFKLHESIASNKKIKPATKQDLQLYGIDNLDIGSIMAAINDKI